MLSIGKMGHQAQVVADGMSDGVEWAYEKGVQVQSTEVALDELKCVVMEYLQYDQQKADPYLALDDAMPAVLAKIRAAASFADVFRAIALPAVDEALDLL